MSDSFTNSVYQRLTLDPLPENVSDFLNQEIEPLTRCNYSATQKRYRLYASLLKPEFSGDIDRELQELTSKIEEHRKSLIQQPSDKALFTRLKFYIYLKRVVAKLHNIQLPNSIKSDALPWDFVAGHKEGRLAISKPKSTTEAAYITLEGRMPFCILIPEKDANGSLFQLYVDDGDIMAELSFKKHVAQRDDAISIATVDKYGEFTWSNFKMKIIAGDPKECSLDSLIYSDGMYNNELIFTLSLNIIRKFLQSYIHTWHLESFKYPEEIRNKLSLNWIPEFGYRRLSPFRNTMVFNAEGGVLHEQSHIDYRGTGVGLGTDIRDEGLNLLQEVCACKSYEEGISGYMRIAYRHFNNHEFEAFCVFIAYTIEKKIFIAARSILKNSGLSDHDIDIKFTNTRRRRHDGSFGTISHYQAMNEATGDDNWSTLQPWIDVNQHIWQKRNQISHDGFPKVTKAEAEGMLDAYNCFTSYLQSIT